MTERRALFLLTLATGFLAINTGSNPVYLFLAFILAGWFLDYSWTPGLLSQLTVIRKVPRRFVEGEPSRVILELVNASARSFSYIRVEERSGTDTSDLRTDEFFIEKLYSGEIARLEYEISFPGRGMAIFQPVALSRVGLFESGLSLEAGTRSTIIIHPKPLFGDFLRIREFVQGLNKHSMAAGLEDFQGIVRARKGIRPSLVHWKAFSRTGIEFSKQFIDRKGLPLLVVFIMTGRELAEHGVRVAAGVAESLNEEKISFEFITYADFFSTRIPGSDLLRIFDHLALLPPAEKGPAIEELEIEFSSWKGEEILLIFPGEHESQEYIEHLRLMSGGRLITLPYTIPSGEDYFER